MSQSSSQHKVAVGTSQEIQFIDLKAQQERIRDKVDAGIKAVLDHGTYIMGPEVKTLESDLSAFCGAKHSISCSNGTDAIALALRALGVNQGDAVFVPTFTFAATAEVVTWFGATPVFIDVLNDTYNMDPTSLEQGIQTAKSLGLNPKGIIPVDIFGLPADYDAILPIAEKNNLWVISDAAQSFGATYKDRKVGTIGHITTTSFFPAKPLGCYGDGGAVFTQHDELAAIIRSARVHGQGADKYDNVRIGMNGRLDTMQAAVLIEKLKIFPDEIIARNQIAARYTEELKAHVQTPFVPEGLISTWAQYTICLDSAMNRENLMSKLKDQGIPTVIYYVKPLHLQTAYKQYPTVNNGSLPVAENLANHVLSLPMHPYLGNDQSRVIEALLKAL